MYLFILLAFFRKNRDIAQYTRKLINCGGKIVSDIGTIQGFCFFNSSYSHLKNTVRSVETR